MKIKAILEDMTIGYWFSDSMLIADEMIGKEVVLICKNENGIDFCKMGKLLENLEIIH